MAAQPIFSPGGQAIIPQNGNQPVVSVPMGGGYGQVNSQSTPSPYVPTSDSPAINRTVDTSTPDPNADPATAYLNTFQAPKSADQIAEDLRKQSQGQIDAINAEFDSKVAADQKAGQEKVNQNDAVSILAGLMGSTEAGRTRNEVSDANQKVIDADNAQRAAQLASVYGKISSDAQAEAEQQKQDATKSAEDIVARRTQMQTEAVNNLKQMAASGLVDFEAFKNNPRNAAVYQHALDNVGGSEDSLRAIFALNRPQDTLVGSPTRVGNSFVQAYKNPITGKVSYDQISLPFDLPQNYTNFQKSPDGSLLAFPDNWDGDVSQIVHVASPAGTSGSGPSDPQLIAQAIINGNQPPVLTGLYGKSAAVRAELERKGYDLTRATQDYTATQKLLSTLNGAQQTRLREAVNQVDESLGLVQQLADEWNGGRYPALNKVSLLAAKNGVYGPAAQSLATRLDAEIGDITSELGTVYKGGNSSTDESLKLAAQQLSSSWSKSTFDDAIQLARQNIQYRKNSLQLTTAGISDSQYNPTSSSASDTDPLGLGI